MFRIKSSVRQRSTLELPNKEEEEEDLPYSAKRAHHWHL